MNQKGFANIILILIVIALASAGVYFISTRPITLPIPTPSPSPSATTPNPTPTPSPVSGRVTVISIAPSSGSIGTQITIFGSGFTSAKNSVIFGSGMGSIYPNLPGSYDVGVSNANGISNKLTFTVTP